MAPRSYSRMAASRPRRAKRWPLVLLILAVIIGVAATVLLANDRRNLKTLARFLGVPLASTSAASVAPVPEANERPRVSKPEPRWPWPGFAVTPGLIEPAPTPADMCSRQAAGAQEIPAFAESEQRGWECSMLRDHLGPNNSASLFLQARGPLHASAENIRVKFNLAGGNLDGDLATQALGFFRLAASMPRDPALSETLAKLLTTQAGFYFFAGYQSVTFKQEIGDPGRYNFIGTDRTSKALTGHPRLWSVVTENGKAAQDMRTGRLPRLLTLPAGND